MSEFKKMKFFIGSNGDAKTCKMVQGILDDLGYEATSRDSQIIFTESNGDADSYTTHSDPKKKFGELPYEEINIDWMRTTKPETVELNGKTYIKTELEEALRKIKPV